MDQYCSQPSSNASSPFIGSPAMHSVHASSDSSPFTGSPAIAYGRLSYSSPDSLPTRDVLEAQIQGLKEKLADSERGLKRRYDTMLDQIKREVGNKYKASQVDKVCGVFRDFGVDYQPFAKLLRQMTTYASRDSISVCRDWLVKNCDSDQKLRIALTYLLVRCRADRAHGVFLLNILYILHDFAYYCHCNKLVASSKMLSDFVPKMFVHATLTKALSEKLDTLIQVWKNARYFEEDCYENLSKLSFVLETENAIIEREKAKFVEEAKLEVEQAYSNHQMQHQLYVKQALLSISKLENQIDELQGRESGFNATVSHPNLKFEDQHDKTEAAIRFSLSYGRDAKPEAKLSRQF